MALRKVAGKQITQRQASEELGLSVRQVKRLVKERKKRGDEAVVHRLRGKASNRRIEEAVEQEAME
ncbi:MAG: helix-turn-helix domain-containing protein, partial [Acidobacteria bacterium]|nr:helix-turn-helix domain-containing protein [Acidobacteriota bacterium]